MGSVPFHDGCDQICELSGLRRAFREIRKLTDPFSREFIIFQIADPISFPLP